MRDHKEYPVAKWAKRLQVSQSGYYAWSDRVAARKAQANQEKELVRSIFEEGGGCYGPDSICGIIRERGGHMGRDKCKRHMEDMGLSSIHARKRSRSLTNSKKSRGEGFPNLLRNECPFAPRYALSSDITYLRSSEGFS